MVDPTAACDWLPLNLPITIISTALNFQEAEIDGYMFASIDEIKVFAQEGIFLHYDSIKKVFE